MQTSEKYGNGAYTIKSSGRPLVLMDDLLPGRWLTDFYSF